MSLKSVYMTSDTKDLAYSKEDVPAIVRACRAHDALVEAVGVAEYEICNLCKQLNPQHENCTSCDGMDDIKQALAKAKGE